MRLLQASAKPKVGQLDVASAVQQQVVRLDVPVDEVLAVDVLDP